GCGAGVSKEARGGLGLGPAAAGAREAGGGLGGGAVQEDLLTFLEPVVAQVQGLQFLIDPIVPARTPKASPGRADGPLRSRRRNPFPDKIITIRRAHGIAPIGKKETIANFACTTIRPRSWAGSGRPASRPSTTSSAPSSVTTARTSPCGNM